MDYEEKRQFATRELDNAGIWKSNYSPPIYLLLYKLGFQPRFPFYKSFIRNTLESGIYFGICWELLMYFLVWSPENTPASLILLSVLVGGTVFGLLMASYYSYTARKYKLNPMG